MTIFLDTIRSAVRCNSDDPLVQALGWVNKSLKEFVDLCKGGAPDEVHSQVIGRAAACAVLWLPISALGLTDLAVRSVARELFGWPRAYPEMHEVLPGIFMGDIDAATNLELLEHNQVDVVLSLTDRMEGRKKAPDIDYHLLHIDDSTISNLDDILDESLDIIKEARQAGKRVLVHCHMGVSRSGAILVAHCMRTYGWTYDEALSFVQSRRNIAKPNPSFAEQLRDLYETDSSPQPTPRDWSNCRFALENWQSSSAIKVEDGMLVKRSFWSGQSDDVYPALWHSLIRISRLHPDLLSDTQKTLLTKLRRVVDLHGDDCWFVNLRAQLPASTPRISWERLPTIEEDYLPAHFDDVYHNSPKDTENPEGLNSLRNFFSGLFAAGHKGPASLAALARKQEPLTRSDGLSVQFLGHSSVYLQVAGLNIVCDPLFKQGLVSPSHLRYVAPGADPLELDPDVVLVSHADSHHFDKTALSTYCAPQQPLLLFPEGMSVFTDDLGFDERGECGWWDQIQVARGDSEAQITFLPAWHSSSAGIGSSSESLWGGWAIEAEGKTILYLGDTMWHENPDVTDPERCREMWDVLRQRFPEPDLVLAPIVPSAKDALDICEFMDAKTLVPIHWGALRLNADNIEQPLENLAEELAERPQLWERVHTLLVGERHTA